MKTFSSLASYRCDSSQCFTASESLPDEAAVAYFEKRVSNTNGSLLLSTGLVTAA